MAGYSGTPLPKKLGIKDGACLRLAGAPADFVTTLGALPAGARIQSRGNGPFDVIVAFTTTARGLEKHLARLVPQLKPDGGLWIAWPKKSGGVESEISENDVRAAGLAAGLVDNKVCAIDQTWSGLRLVIRLKDRPGAGK